MSVHALAALFVLVVWWLSTAVVLGMVWLRRSTFRISVGLFSVIALAGLAALRWSSAIETPFAAYVAFASSIAVWGFHELTFLLGMVTGPRKEPCPPGARGWERFRLATATVIHHEIALAATLVAIAGLTWSAPNQVGTRTFLVLWGMRLSSKFNVFLGVRNVSEEFIPDHLRYLLSYFRRARINPLMPVVIAASLFFAVRIGSAALAADGAFEQVGLTLVATILGLGVIEHVFLALPLPDALLWRWAIRQRQSRVTGRGASTGNKCQRHLTVDPPGHARMTSLATTRQQGCE